MPMLAVIAAVTIAGLAVAWWRYGLPWFRRRAARPKLSTAQSGSSGSSEAFVYRPEDWESPALDHLPEAERGFWQLFEGDMTSARARRQGGMFVSEAGIHASVYSSPGGLTVIVVAEGPYHEWVNRFVCSRSDGIVYRRESRQQHEGYINHTQARNTNRQGLKTAPDEAVKLMAAQLGGCRRAVLISD